VLVYQNQRSFELHRLYDFKVTLLPGADQHFSSLLHIRSFVDALLPRCPSAVERHLAESLNDVQ
jgi:hypothetical protein